MDKTYDKNTPHIMTSKGGAEHAQPKSVRYNTHKIYTSNMVQGYCVKCRKKVEIKDPVEVTMKNGRAAVKGTCPETGSVVFRIGKL